MTKLDELIAELCPNGVEYKTLGEVCEMQRGTSLTKANSVEGVYPVISGGREPAFYCNQFNRDGETITIAGSGAGAGFVQYWNEKIFVCDAFSIKGKESLKTKFVYHCLSNLQEEIYATKKGGGVPHVHISSIENFQIPVPPLPVQEEIVRILDKFTSLTAELTAELTARRKQYEYYRDALLTPPFGSTTLTDRREHFEILTDRGEHYDRHAERNNQIRLLSNVEASEIKDTMEAKVEIKKLGEICQQISNIKWKNEKNSFQYIDLTSVDRETHEIINTTKIDSSNAPSRAQQIVKENDVLFGTTRPMLKRSTFISKEFDGQICSTGYCVLRPNQEIVKPRYIYHHINSSLFYQYVETHQQGASYPAISDADVKNFTIPLPPLSVQQRIVNVLDNFDAICSDLEIGLPAEIDARKRQYEYYRDLLLTFAERGNTIRTEQNRTEQNRTEQNRTEQNRTEQNR